MNRDKLYIIVLQVLQTMISLRAKSALQNLLDDT